jgi:hypothetical protein
MAGPLHRLEAAKKKRRCSNQNPETTYETGEKANWEWEKKRTGRGNLDSSYS